MAAKHIFVFFECFTLGGVERSALAHMREWVRQGRRVTLFVGAPEGPLLAELSEGVDVMGGGADTYMAMFRPTIAAVRACRPDIVFVPGNHYTSIACILRLALGSGCPPIVAKVSNAFDRRDQTRFRRFWYRAFLRAHVRLIDHFTALSATMRREALGVSRMTPGQVSVIADPPIARAVTRELSDAARVDHPVDARPSIAVVGRLVPQKRVDMLVRAFSRLPAALGARLDIVGDGPEQARVEAEIVACGVADRVRMHGYLADPAPIIARARVLALSSIYEGMPAVILEALALGTPVVSTDSTSSLAEFLDDPRLGTVVPLDDEAALARALAERLAVEPDRAAIRARARTPMGWPEAAAAYLALFDRLASTRPRRLARPWAVVDALAAAARGEGVADATSSLRVPLNAR